MEPLNVVVVFYCRDGETERLALAAGVGAVQARSSIRLRRLADQTPPDNPDWQRHLDRMNREYIAPRPVDLEWADLILLAAPPFHSEEIENFLRTSQDSADKIEKLPHHHPTNADSARALGRQAAEKARLRKALV